MRDLGSLEAGWWDAGKAFMEEFSFEQKDKYDLEQGKKEDILSKRNDLYGRGARMNK